MLQLKRFALIKRLLLSDFVKFFVAGTKVFQTIVGLTPQSTTTEFNWTVFHDTVGYLVATLYGFCDIYSMSTCLA